MYRNLSRKYFPRTEAGAAAVADRLLSETEVAARLGVSKAWLQRDRWGTRLLPFVKFPRAVKYREADVLSFIESRMQGVKA